jgi:hypothetical protein
MQMIPTNNLTNPLQLLLEVLSMFQQPAFVGGLSKEENKKAMEFFNSPANGLGQTAVRTISIDHSVKIISSLLSNQSGNKCKFQPLNEAADSNIFQTIESSNPVSIINDNTLRFIQVLIARIINGSSQDLPTNEQNTMANQPVMLPENKNQAITSIKMQGFDVDIDSSPALSQTKSYAVSAPFLKVATNPERNLSMHSDEGSQAHQRSESKDVSLSIPPLPKTQSPKPSSRIGDRGEAFQPTPDPIQKQTGDRPGHTYPLSLNQAALSIVKSAETVNIPAPAPLTIEITKVHSRGADQTIVTGAVDSSRIIPSVLPYSGLFSNSSFLAPRRKKDKKKKSDDDETEERESNASTDPWQGFEF